MIRGGFTIDKRVLLLLIILLLSTLPLSTINVSGQETDVTNLRIAMTKLSPRSKQGNPLIVSGFYHTVEFDTNKEPVVNLTKGNTTYNWYFDGQWQGDLSYMDVEKSSQSGSHYKMLVGLEVNEEAGIWDLEINGVSFDVTVEKPVRGFGIHMPDFIFRFQPFTSTTKSSDPQKYTLECEGNSVLEYETHFNKFNSRINVSDPSGILKPGEEIDSTISFTSKKWKPGYLNFSGSVTIRPIDVISNATYQFVPEYQLDITGQTIVGHKGFEIKEISDGVIIQYKENLELYYGNKKAVNFYLSGNKRINLDVITEKLKLTSFSGMGKSDLPAVVQLEPGKEYKFEVEVKPTRKETTGSITYSVKEQSKEREYTTDVKILRPIDGYDETDESGINSNKYLNMIIIITGLSLFVGYLILSKNGGE